MLQINSHQKIMTQQPLKTGSKPAEEQSNHTLTDNNLFNYALLRLHSPNRVPA